jgi:hypothetical protein
VLLKSIKIQTMVLLRRKSVAIVFFAVLAFVLHNFYTNIYTFRGEDVNTMIHPMRILFLSQSIDRYNLFFFQYYPIFVIIPAAFAYLSDKTSREIVFIQGRTGKRDYFIGQLLSCFIVTFFVFFIPLCLEAILNCIAFPLQSSADIGVGGFFDPIYIENIHRYLFPGLWGINSYLYSFLNIVGIGFLSGVLSAFALSVSTLPFIKFKILLFIPVYALLYLISAAEKLFSLNFTTNYYAYISMFDINNKSEIALLVFLGALILFCCINLYINIRKDI